MAQKPVWTQATTGNAISGTFSANLDGEFDQLVGLQYWPHWAARRVEVGAKYSDIAHRADGLRAASLRPWGPLLCSLVSAPGPGFVSLAALCGCQYEGPGDNPEREGATRPFAFGAGIRGRLGGVGADAQGYFLYGWACEEGSERSIDVHVYAGGLAGRGQLVKGSRADVANERAVNEACGTAQSHHRFKVRLTAAEQARFGGEKIYIYGISARYPNALLVRSGQEVFPAADDPTPRPTGLRKALLPINGNGIVRGCVRPQSGSALSVDLYLGHSGDRLPNTGVETPVVRLVADKPTPADLTAACDSGRNAFEYRLPWRYAVPGLSVYAYAINPKTGEKGDEIGVRNVPYRYEIGYEDNNLGVHGGVPQDFETRLTPSGAATWAQARKEMRSMVLRMGSVKHYPHLMARLAEILNRDGVTVTLDDVSATWARYTQRVASASELDYGATIRRIETLLDAGLTVRSIALQSVLSKPNPNHPLYASPSTTLSLNTRVGDILAYFRQVQRHFQRRGISLDIGIIDAKPAHGADFRQAYRTLVTRLGKAGFKLAFIDLDHPLDLASHSTLVAAQRYVTNTLQTRCGVFITHAAGGRTSAAAFRSGLLSELSRALRQGLRADRFVLAAWYPHPRLSAPDDIRPDADPKMLRVFREMNLQLARELPY